MSFKKDEVLALAEIVGLKAEYVGEDIYVDDPAFILGGRYYVFAMHHAGNKDVRFYFKDLKNPKDYSPFERAGFIIRHGDILTF